MARNIGTFRFTRAGTIAGIVLAVMFCTLPASWAQDEPVRGRSRVYLDIAIKSFKRGDYEIAAKHFEQVTPTDLNAAEQRDLSTFSKQNATALKGQGDGENQLRQADEALKRGDVADASRLLKSLSTNPYLTPQDKTHVSNLNEQMRATMVASGTTPSSRQLLYDARLLLQNGDLDGADALATQVEKMGTGFWPLPIPFSDTAAKVHHDVQQARDARLRSTSPQLAKPEEKGTLRSFVGTLPFVGKKEDKTIVRGPEPKTSDVKAPEAPAIFPKGDQATPVVQVGDAGNLTAPQLIAQGYKSLAAGDFVGARKYALAAKEMHPDLAYNQPNPEGLLAEIERKANSPATAPVKTVTTLEPRGILKDARTLYQADKLDEAEQVLAQLSAIPNTRWGHFEDTPDKLRADLKTARARHDREESMRLMVEARKAYAKGNLAEAKSKAQRAVQLHGPYSVFDTMMGDSPDSLLRDINRAEQKSPTEYANPNQSKVNANPGMQSVAAKPNPKGELPPLPPPLPPAVAQGPRPSTTVMAQNKQLAVALLVEARSLQAKGQILEARQKALEAKKLDAAFALTDDSPENVLTSLAAQCDAEVNQSLRQVSERIMTATNDPERFKKAQTDLLAARQLAQAFGQDLVNVDQKLQWLQQVAAATVQATQPNMMPAPIAPILQTTATQTPPGIDPKQRQIGLERLDKARLELKAGNTSIARRLAEEAFDAQFGIQQEAQAVLRSINAEEHNQALNNMRRQADAVVDAYMAHDFSKAQALVRTLDLSAIPMDLSRRIAEIANTPEMQGGGLRTVDFKVPPTPASNAPGVDTAGDLPGKSMIDQMNALEKIQFQKLREQGLVAQRTAQELFKKGDEDRALNALRDYLDQLQGCQLDAAQVDQLKRPVEVRLSQLKTMHEQNLIAKQSSPTRVENSEQIRTASIRKNQEDVGNLIKQEQTFKKEGKYREALAQIRKVKELDPDNTVADSEIFRLNILINQDRWDKQTAENADSFVSDLTPGMGPTLDPLDHPVEFNQKTAQRAIDRSGTRDGLPINNHYSPAHQAIENKLSQEFSFDWKNAPLNQVIADLQSMTGLNVVPDRAALQEANISLDQALSLTVERIALRSVLNILLEQAHLAYMIKDDVLQITTPEHAEGRMVLKAYPVADLVVPVENHETPKIYRLDEALTRSLPGGMGANSPTPLNNPLGLSNGQTVSNPYSTGSSSSSGAGAQTALNKYMTENTMENLLKDLITNAVHPNSWTNVGGKGSIQYYPLGLVLVINQSQEVHENIVDLLAALRRLQDLEVAVEMRLVSVSESFFEKIGVDFDLNILLHNSRFQPQITNGVFAPQGQLNSFQPSGFVSGLTPAGTFTPDLNLPINNSSYGFSNPPFGGFPGTLGADGGLSLGLAFLSDIQVFMFMEAAQGDRRVQVMQAPKITVYNGQTANINVSTTTYFLTNVSLTQSGAQTYFVPANTPVPTGVNLQVTPVVSADRRFVRLNLSPSLTSIASATVPLIPVQIPVPQVFDGLGASNLQPVIFQMFFQQPSFDTISLQTTVNVPDGGTVLLGGLKTLAAGRNEFGPPILSKIPYISRLFRNSASGSEAQSLMIMVTPRIIINEEEEQIYLGQIAPIPRP